MTRKRIKSRSTAGLLAIFFGHWTFIYTFKDDSLKFFICLILNLCLWWTLIVPIGLWIYSMVKAYGRDDKWYKEY